MSLAMPWLAILLGAVLVAVGATVGQWGWNWQSEVKQRQEMVRNLAETNQANHATLAAVIDASGTRAPPVETELFTAVLASGLFAEERYSELRARIRSTQAALREYNSAAGSTQVSGAWATGPKNLPANVALGLAEIESLAALLAARYGASSLSPGSANEPR